MTVRLRARWASLLIAMLTVLAIGAVSPMSSSAAAARCGANDFVGDRIPLLFLHGFISKAGVWDKAVKRFDRPVVPGSRCASRPGASSACWPR